MKIAKQPEGRLEKIGPVFHISLRASWSPKCRKSFSEPYRRHIGNTCLSFSTVLMGTICSSGVCFCLILSNQMLSGGYSFQMLYSSTVRKYSNFAFDSWNIHLEPGSMIDIMVVCFWTYLLAKFISLALGWKTSADFKSSKNIISFGFGWWFRWFNHLLLDNFIPCLFCGLKLR